MVALDITATSQALAVAGGYVLFIGLVSYFIKEKLFLCASPSHRLTHQRWTPLADSQPRLSWPPSRASSSVRSQPTYSTH